MRAALLRQYFGREWFGTIHGFTLGVMMLGNIAGAPLAGLVFDTWHSYQGVWLALAALTVVAAGITLTIPRVSKHKLPSG
jgi:predicted MFS family arabinose efflux permease